MRASAGVAKTADSAKRPKKKVLAGRKRVKKLVLKRGVTYLVKKDLSVVSKTTITINGRILVYPGASINLQARGRIVNNAPIRPVPRSRLLAQANAPPLQCGAERIKEWAFGSVEVDAPIEGAEGGTARNGNGCDGQDIVIVSLFRRVHIRAAVTAGTGGPGRSDRSPTVYASLNACRNDHKTVMPLTGKPGGRGGDVAIFSGLLDSTPIVRPGVSIKPGKGGRGGDAGGAEPTSAPSGTPGHAGSDVIARSGAGGNAGIAYWARHKDAERHYLAGANGGAPGNIRVRAGNGGVPNCDGGRTEAILGKTGLGSRPSAHLLGNGFADEVYIAGGNAYEQPPAEPGQPGGRGGDIAIREAFGDGLGTPAFVRKMSVLDAANGGPGSSGCAASPIRSGGNGGRGGDLSFGGGSLRALADIGGSFNGGRGGDGDPLRGLGGREGGSDWRIDENERRESFRPGEHGNSCPQAAYRYEVNDGHATWTNPFQNGAPVSGTFTLKVCGNPLTDPWQVTKNVGGQSFPDFVILTPGSQHDRFNMTGYRSVDGTDVADAWIRASVTGTPPDLTVFFTPDPFGSTTFTEVFPHEEELHGTFVGTRDECQ